LYHSGRTKRDSTSISLKIRAEESEDKTEVTDPKDPRVKEEEEEVPPDAPEKSLLPRPTNPLRPPPQLDWFVNLSLNPKEPSLYFKI